MSYITNNTQQFILAKVTQKGRELLSKGKLNFTQWAIGDSEINYNVTGQTTEFLIPKDKQPEFKFFIPNSSGNLMTLLDNELKSQKIKLVNSREVITTGSPIKVDWSDNINWSSSLLQFNPICNFQEPIIAWRKQNIFKESIIGTTGNTKQQYDYIKSAKYLGQFNILDDDSADFSDTNGLNPCLDYSESIIDNNKSMTVMYYDYDKAFNFYGEELFVDDTNPLTVYLPDLEYHRTLETSGMTFVSDTKLKYLNSNEIPYYDLLEDIDKTIDDKANIVGRVFPGLQLITFNNDEIVAALEDKSGRKFTLPEIQINLLPTNKNNEVVLNENEVIYMSYMINEGMFPCQNIVKTINLGKSGKYIKVDFVSDMKDSVDIDIYKIDLLWQKVSTNEELPLVDAWNKIDVTGYYANKNLDTLYLKASDLITNQFKLVDYNVNLSDNVLGTNDFIKSTVNCSYASDIYKSIFTFHLSGDEFTSTTNSTFKTAQDNKLEPNIKISEVGIYSDSDELVIIGKLGYPIEIKPESTVTIHLEIDF